MNTFETERLYIKKAEPILKDSEILTRLHNNPEVMKYVGFPDGLNTTTKKEKSEIEKKYNTDDAKLLVYTKNNNSCIGSCKIGIQNKKKFCEIDYKLFPKFQGLAYGTEIIKGLAKFIFETKKYKGIETTPNKNNIASQKICEKIGMKKIGEGLWKAPENKQNIIDVPFYTYQITNEQYFKLKNI